MTFSPQEIVKMLGRAGMGDAPQRPLRLSLSKWTKGRPKVSPAYQPPSPTPICHATGRRIRSLPITVEQLL
jgi:hypothetical protein